MSKLLIIRDAKIFGCRDKIQSWETRIKALQMQQLWGTALAAGVAELGCVWAESVERDRSEREGTHQHPPAGPMYGDPEIQADLEWSEAVGWK